MSSRLYVGNLPYHATEDLITQHFSASGEVKAVNLMIDRMSGQSRGFCFVEMATADAAQKAIADLNGKDFAGRSLPARWRQPPRRRLRWWRRWWRRRTEWWTQQ
jgi:RNA recognition motif-containing protein